MIGSSAQQVNRWTTEREKIPFKHIGDLALQIGVPGAVQYVEQLKYCQVYAERFYEEIHHLAIQLGTDHDALQATIISEVERLALQDQRIIPFLSLPQVLSNYILHASFAVRLAKEMIEVDFIEPIIAAHNIVRHLTYPVNRFVGLLINAALLMPMRRQDNGLQNFRTQVLANLRKTVGNGLAAGSSDNLLEMHAIHLLARYGEKNDAAYVEQIVYDIGRVPDPLTRRLGYMGLVIAYGEERTEHFLHELSIDDNLAQADIVFDAVHYGDVNINLQPIPQRPPRLRNAIFHNLKHISDPSTRRIRPLDYFRLLRILQGYGSDVFADPMMVFELNRILAQNDTEASTNFKAIQDGFQRQFRRAVSDLEYLLTERPGNMEEPETGNG